MLFERSPDDYDPIGLARRYLDGADIVLTEGYKAAPLPKIEVFRRAVADSPDLRSSRHRTPIAVGGDRHRRPASRPTCPVLRFNDTIWLQLLANLAWERSLVLDP